MKKVKNQKKLFWHLQVDLKGIWKNFFFCANSKWKIVASVHCAYASKDKMVRTWPTLKKINYLFQPSCPLPIETLWHKHTWAPLSQSYCLLLVCVFMWIQYMHLCWTIREGLQFTLTYILCRVEKVYRLFLKQFFLIIHVSYHGQQ